MEFELDKFDYDDLPKYPVICNLVRVNMDGVEWSDSENETEE